jgi:hypothetical protein
MIVLAAVLLAAQFSVPAQTVLYEQPKRLKLRGIAEENPKTDAMNVYNGIMTELFYPIGWSEDGKFAYYVEPPDEACGCYFGTLVIQDLKTDKILWEDRYNGSDTEPINENETINDHWKDKQKLFSEKLAQYGIKQQKEFKLEYPSFKYENDVFTPKLESKLRSSDDLLYISGFVRLTMFSKSKGKKTIYEQKYNPKEVSGIQGADLTGVLQSPYEARAAIVIVETLRGYEGPPNVTSIKIIGSTFTTGFKSR